MYVLYKYEYTDFSWEYKLKIHGLSWTLLLFSILSEETDDDIGRI